MILCGMDCMCLNFVRLKFLKMASMSNFVKSHSKYSTCGKHTNVKISAVAKNLKPYWRVCTVRQPIIKTLGENTNFALTLDV